MLILGFKALRQRPDGQGLSGPYSEDFVGCSLKKMFINLL